MMAFPPFEVMTKPMRQLLRRLLLCASFVCTHASAASSVIDGQVFIVTKGQQTYKLPLVTIIAVPEKRLQSEVQRQTQRHIATLESVGATIEEKKKEISQIKTALVAADGESMPPFEEYEVLSAVCPTSAGVEAYMICARTPGGQESTSRLKALREQYSAEFDKVFALRKAMRDLMKQHRATAVLLRSLPASDTLAESVLATTKTDGDGKFTLTVPSGAPVVLLAQASRDTGGKTEHYQWAVIVPARPGAKTTLFLANDNLLETGCAACLKMRNIMTYPDHSGYPEYFALQ